MVRVAEPLADARARPARAPHRLSAGGRGGARLDARRGRRVGQRRELQRRARRGVVLRRPALQPGGGPRRGARAADGRRSRTRPRAPAPTSRSRCCSGSRPPPPTRAHPAARALARCVEAVEGAAPRFELCPGVLETRWYAQLGVPAFAYGARAARRLARPGRVHRRGRDAPLRRGLRAVRGRRAGIDCAPCTTTATSASTSPPPTTTSRRRCSSPRRSTRSSTCWSSSPAAAARSSSASARGASRCRSRGAACRCTASTSRGRWSRGCAPSRAPRRSA